jgi:Flp pilus assembly protein TadG
LTGTTDSPGKRRRIRRSRRKNRRGAAVVEFAVIAPLLFMLIFGMIEFGRLIMVQQILTNASREGARRAVLEHASVSEVESVVADYLSGASVSGASVTVSPSPLSVAGFGDPVTVGCSIPFAQVSWLPAPWFLSETQLSAESIMNAERPE